MNLLENAFIPWAMWTSRFSYQISTYQTGYTNSIMGKMCLISLQSQYEKSETPGPVGTDNVGIESENVKRSDEV